MPNAISDPDALAAGDLELVVHHRGARLSEGPVWDAEHEPLLWVDRCFWAGSMSYDETPGAGCLYRLDGAGRATGVVSDVTVPNGIGWSPDARTMYFADSAAGAVDAFDWPGDDALPAAQVTSCAFGGRALDELYITTAAYDLAPHERRSQPLAGAMFRCRPWVRGLPATPYAG